jgi:putative spermidine/putrescine transport system substrate-binding protein
MEGEEIMAKKSDDFDNSRNSRGVNRRTLLKGAGAAAGGVALGSGAVTGFPVIWAQNAKDVVLRQFGTGISAQPAIMDKVQKDLGFRVEMAGLDSNAIIQRAITQPDSYDIADIEFWIAKKVFVAGNMQPIDTSKIKLYDKITPLFTTGKLNADSKVAQGTPPHTVGYMIGPTSRAFAKEQTKWATILPLLYNADTLGVRPDLFKHGEVMSWADMLSPDAKGKAAIVNIPNIGIMDVAMVLESAGLMAYGDKGNMTTDEMDKTFDHLGKFKREGQFRAFWQTFQESVNLMAAGETVIQSMFSEAITAVRVQGVACRAQPMKEGYRAWGSGLGLSANLKGLPLDCANEYLNWCLDGWVGARLGRQGYYAAILDTTKANMTPDEWGYWYEGKAAAADILSPTGQKIDGAGGKRDGGSFNERMGHLACWNAVMDNDRYLLRKWNEFVSA